ncbi:MAG TPA: alpha/beta fold hydrolase [Xanthobacteraceae bacterium]|nr:alpha/beta fold hydrolase [Xanthobacteraceae bacterium]
MNEHRHKVRDVSVRVRRDGKGPPLVYLHGPAGLPEWTPFFVQLAQAHEVMVPEHPGFGTSDNPAWIRNVGDVAMYYLDFLDGLNAPRVHLVGHALGGWIAAEVAVRNAARLASLTLIAPAGLRQKGLPAGDNFIWSPEETVRNLFYDQSFAEKMLAHVPSEEEADLALTNRFMAAKLGWEPRWFNPALERWLHRIPVPTLVLWGADDKFLPSQYVERWRARVPDVTVEILPQCGHLPQVERADATATRIVRFLKGNAS